MEWSEGDLVWFDPNIGHPLPGEIQEVHQAAQVIIVQALINGKVSEIFGFLYLFSMKKNIVKMLFLKLSNFNLVIKDKNTFKEVKMFVDK